MSRAQRPRIEVEVDDRQAILPVSATSLIRLVRRVLGSEGIVAAEIGLTLIDDRRMAALNRQWLKHEGPTDVITFPLSGRGAFPRSGPDEPALVGDIAVSVETAHRVAREVGWRPRQELAYYVVHGLLHLVGYDDRTVADRRAMRARERRAMRLLGLPSPPATRSGSKKPS